MFPARKQSLAEAMEAEARAKEEYERCIVKRLAAEMEAKEEEVQDKGLEVATEDKKIQEEDAPMAEEGQCAPKKKARKAKATDGESTPKKKAKAKATDKKDTHTFNLGDHVVVRENAGGMTWFDFGKVVRCTPHIVGVDMYEPKKIEGYSDGGGAWKRLTCDFTTRLGVTEEYRWLPSSNRVGRPGASLRSTEVNLFDPDSKYEAISYY